MGLQQASKVGSISDIIDIILFQGTLFYFLLPLIGIALAIYLLRSIKKHIDKKEDEKIDAANRNNKSNQNNKVQLNKQNNNIKQNLTKVNLTKASNRNSNTINLTRVKHKSSRPLGTTETMLKKLDNIEEPIVKSEYRNLAINFDKNGKIIK